MLLEQKRREAALYLQQAIADFRAAPSVEKMITLNGAYARMQRVRWEMEDAGIRPNN